MQLSPHFSFEEMTASQTAARHSISNLPGNDALQNLKRLCTQLEVIRALLNRPIVVTSGYRAPEVNRLVGSRDSSQHVKGCAVDFKVPGMTPDMIIRAIIDAGISYDQLIREYDA